VANMVKESLLGSNAENLPGAAGKAPTTSSNTDAGGLADLGGLAGEDIMAAAFITMMDATKGAQWEWARDFI